ncbi:MAG: hypothetical protein IPK12_22010 [Gemmatimonadetes bacterium]|nr:hypothetical protein [Gemmatimonadota bacterium]
MIRDSLRRQLDLLQFEQGRRQVRPFAEARGYLTDEDVFTPREFREQSRST